jgi:outer membrane protein assembly factor BamB
VFSVAADGLLRGLIPDTGDLALAPAPFLPPNSTATGLIWTDGVVYAATVNTCGAAPTGVFAMDFESENKPVTLWESDGAPIAGIALGGDGTIYAATGGGTSQYANSIVALEARTLKVKDWYTTAAGEPFISTPVIFAEGERTFVAATTPAGIHLLDAASPGGGDHKTPVHAMQAADLRWVPEALSTWVDPRGVRWVLGPANGAVVAFRLGESGGRPALERVWMSRALTNPRTPIVVNGVVFALSGGSEGTPAVLYALDPSNGKDLWTSGAAITSHASAGLSAGTGQVYVVTADNTVWSFGIPLAIN